jgi:hypothetical protein
VVSQVRPATLTGLVAALHLMGLAIAAGPQNTEAPEDLFQRIKARVSEHFAKLPNYTCHETIDRATRSGSTWKHVDTVEFEVAFVGNEELFSRPGDAEFRPRPVESLVSGGLFGNSAIGSHIDVLFSSDAAEFKQVGTQKKDGRKTIRYDLRVPIEKSRFRVRHGPAEGLAGYEGSVWVDPETLDLVRVDFKVNRIPSQIGVALIEESMHYKTIRVGTSEFNLPDHSELSATDITGFHSVNTIKLNRCREFGAESMVKYGPPTQGTATRERQDQK